MSECPKGLWATLLLKTERDAALQLPEDLSNEST